MRTLTIQYLLTSFSPSTHTRALCLEMACAAPDTLWVLMAWTQSAAKRLVILYCLGQCSVRWHEGKGSSGQVHLRVANRTLR